MTSHLYGNFNGYLNVLRVDPCTGIPFHKLPRVSVLVIHHQNAFTLFVTLICTLWHEIVCRFNQLGSGTRQKSFELIRNQLGYECVHNVNVLTLDKVK